MSLIKTITRPVRNLSDAIFMPFKAVFVVGLCWAINAMTFHGVWWVQWVALGMGIATLVALARGIKTLLVLGLTGWLGMKIYRRWGPEARRRFDEWMASTQPDAASLAGLLKTPAAHMPSGLTGEALRH